jgi:hypothetical protein
MTANLEFARDRYLGRRHECAGAELRRLSAGAVAVFDAHVREPVWWCPGRMLVERQHATDGLTAHLELGVLVLGVRLGLPAEERGVEGLCLGVSDVASWLQPKGPRDELPGC